MAISFNNAQTLSTTGPGTTITNTINIGTTNSKSVLVVGGIGHTASDAITSVTWNGVAMTKVQVQAPTGANDRHLYIFILVAPATGTHDLVVNNSSSVYFFGYVSVYDGCAAAQPDNSGKSTKTASTSYDLTLTLNSDNCWLVGVADHYDGNIAAGTGTSLRTATAVTGIGDSNSALAAGSRSIQFTGSNQTWTGVFLSLKPYTETGAFLLNFI